MAKPKKKLPDGAHHIVCFNHGCCLQGVRIDEDGSGAGQCPVSKCYFEFHVDTEQQQVCVDKDGNHMVIAVPQGDGDMSNL